VAGDPITGLEPGSLIHDNFADYLAELPARPQWPPFATGVRQAQYPQARTDAESAHARRPV
jgi:hypothetical protein